MDNFLIELYNRLIYSLPYSYVTLGEIPIGYYTYSLLLVILLGELIVLRAKKVNA